MFGYGYPGPCLDVDVDVDWTWFDVDLMKSELGNESYGNMCFLAFAAISIKFLIPVNQRIAVSPLQIIMESQMVCVYQNIEIPIRMKLNILTIGDTC